MEMWAAPHCCVCVVTQLGPRENELKGADGERRQGPGILIGEAAVINLTSRNGPSLSLSLSLWLLLPPSRLPYKQCLRVGFHQRSILSTVSTPGLSRKIK